MYPTLGVCHISELRATWTKEGRHALITEYEPLRRISNLGRHWGRHRQPRTCIVPRQASKPFLGGMFLAESDMSRLFVPQFHHIKTPVVGLRAPFVNGIESVITAAILSSEYENVLHE